MFAQSEKGQRKFAQSGKQQTLSAEFALPRKSQTMFGELNPFRLSRSHYLVLMRMKNAEQRRFYEIEAIDGQWTLDRLKSEYNGSLYERLVLSRAKDEIMRREKEKISRQCGFLRTP
jgi:hypothetical protein